MAYRLLLAVAVLLVVFIEQLVESSRILQLQQVLLLRPPAVLLHLLPWKCYWHLHSLPLGLELP